MIPSIPLQLWAKETFPSNFVLIKFALPATWKLSSEPRDSENCLSIEKWNPF